ncbi:flavodoxin family protein [Geomonas sp. Red32]|uniref:flavodoxin family protein n=1 Tax=Geomonas sp. Red32 TaxID=2912856 RepID=UPI00202CE467|nr:flavodoxin family protein [Geomonas sp. Red32]MCM0081149.1 flavodoxin family protein [Geomonas sp. Red32]
MKIIAINGSPRGMNGTTGKLLEEVLAGATEAGAEVEIVELSKTPITPCVACDRCHAVGPCPLKDEYEVIKAKMEAADAVVLASPNYIFSVTAQMKSFIDRCNGLAHRTALEGKYAVVVETSGGGGDDEVLDYMLRVVNSWGAQCVGKIGSPGMGPRKFPNEEALFGQARTLGRELCASVREQRHFPEQDEWRLAFKARMEQLIGFMREYWPYEREYLAKR